MSLSSQLFAGIVLCALLGSDEVPPFFTRWCASCHSGTEPEGELSLDARELTGTSFSRSVLRNVRSRLLRGEMPPPGKKRPPPEEVEQMLDWLAAQLSREREGAANPGRTTLRRLSRIEFRNSVRDLLEVPVELDSFPRDDLGYGFDNIADVLRFSPLLLEKYADAVERIAREAIVDENPGNPPRRRVECENMSSTLGARSQRGPVQVLFSEGEVAEEFEFPRDGEYLVRVRATADQAGGEPAKMAFGVDGLQRHALAVTNQNHEYEVFERRLTMTAGSHKISAGFINDYYKEDHPDPAQRDRNLLVDWVEVVGPVDPPVLPFAHRRIFASDWPELPVPLRAEAVLRPLMTRAWRRPVTAPEVRRIAALVEQIVEEGGSFAAGVRLALQAILLSPHFLYVAQPDHPAEPPPVDIHPRATAFSVAVETGGVRALTPYELASRLSLFLWSSIPDDELRAVAADGRITETRVLEAQTRRMLRDARSSALAENFAAQWLELRGLEDVEPDPDRFPGFDRSLALAMRRETELLFEAVLREGRPVAELLDARFTFLNDRLAEHYGVRGVSGPHFRRVRVSDDRRRGLLGHASILTVTSNPTRTSPVKRGKWLLANLLDAAPPPPPPGVSALPETADETPKTLREQLELHRRDPSCATCHVRMDALGFALENFDGVGAWRGSEAGVPVDASGALPDGQIIDGPADLRSYLREDPSLLRTVAKKLMVYALGRGLEEADEDTLDGIMDELTDKFGNREPSLEDLILELVSTDAFLHRSLR